MFIYRVAPILFFFFASFGVVAQTNPIKDNQHLGIIMGSILDAAKGDGVPFARVDLKRLTLDSLKRSTLSDKNGSFEFNKLPLGYYSISISSMGFLLTQLDSIYLRAERYDFNLGDIKLKPASDLSLSEVIVYAEKPLFENKDDKLTYNIGESALSNGSSTAELLKNIPLVNNDPNGRLLLKGREPKILIDDKPTELNAQQLQDLLESLPGSSIEKIEIMTNPPPQFATETGGVINIITKKGKIGWVGRLNISAGTRGEGNFSGNISYRNKKFTYNQTIGVGASQLMGNSYNNRTNLYADSSNRLFSTTNYTNINTRPNIRTQVDYEFSKSHLIGLVYQGNMNYFNNISNNSFTNYNRLNEAYRISNRENRSEGDGFTHSIQGSYIYKAPKNLAEQLRFFISANTSKNDNDRNFYQQFLNAGMVRTGIDSTQTQYFNNYNKSITTRVEYIKPLKLKNSQFTTGSTYYSSWFHNTLNTNFLRKSDGVMIPNDLLSNDFYFKQQIFTVRAGFSLWFKKDIRLSFGAQAEQTITAFDFVKGNVSNTTSNYWNVLPNLTLRKDFNKVLNTSLVYRATIRRPGIGELNPNIDYSDPYNLRYGNPDLQPTLSHNFDFNVNYTKGKYYFNTSVGYNKVSQVFNTIRTLGEGGKTNVTWLNISDRNEYEASAFGGYTFNKQFRMNASAGFTYNQYGESEKKLYLYQDGGSFYTNLNYTFTPNSVWTFEGTARYNRYANPQGISRTNINTNFGVQHKLFNRRLILSFNAIDPFTPQELSAVTNGPRFQLESFSTTRSRNYRISISYQLNRMIQKSSLSEKEKNKILNQVKKAKT
ncbi:outer membrane beta-barrel protein [Sediminibacterium sp.]|uniref:outer membrane beta-barrel protein n=1 Tax=Sediminibacterium sp. TaxID=1917865 RepID=UPI00271BB13C|nr:outer membrane beta-barrel protein [Sediminibacterium sp.]MDO8996224.1 outer membrane beta-barrel protein [Sediminibacterium sp.]MDP2420941.1 outer membrane beta-barrel protein [Sediminibacterium sp.]